MRSWIGTPLAVCPECGQERGVQERLIALEDELRRLRGNGERGGSVERLRHANVYLTARVAALEEELARCRGVVVPVPARRFRGVAMRAVYGALAARAGAAVPYAELARALWGVADRGEDARRAIRTTVSRLRAALPPGERIETVADVGYRLVVEERHG